MESRSEIRALLELPRLVAAFNVEWAGAVARPSGRASGPGTFQAMLVSGNNALPDGRATAPVFRSEKRRQAAALQRVASLPMRHRYHAI